MKRTIVALLFVVASVVSLSAQEQTQAQARPMTRQEYVEKYKSIAIDHMRRYGIPASITMAQGILESGAGNSELARRSNNHFGIKCKAHWTGAKVYHDDDAKGECFRAYPSVEESYEDHAKFLDESPRYDSLFAYPSNDYRSWARGLKACGYATAKDYAERLVKVIEDMKLYLLDEEGLKPANEKPEVVAPAVDSNATIKQEEASSMSKKEMKQSKKSKKLDVHTTPKGLSKSKNSVKSIEPEKSQEPEKQSEPAKSQAPAKHQEPAKSQEPAKQKESAKKVVLSEDVSVAVSGHNIDPNNFRVTVNSHNGYDVYRANETFYVVAKKGDTFESIGKAFSISPNMLRHFNDVPKGEELSKSDIVYIEPKQRAWRGNGMQHIVMKGENLYLISQLYGIRMKSLLKLNKLSDTDEVKIGAIVQLQ